jgi:UPF0716 protein FxsA
MGRMAFLLVFIGIPLIEIALFVVVGERIGLLWTIAIVIATAIAGTSLLRMQGAGALANARAAMDSGRLPVESVADGVFLLIAGILLLTPGFLTDFIGFLLFIPGLRHTIGRAIWQRLTASGMVDIRSGPRGEPSQGGPAQDQSRPGGYQGGPVIEGEIIDPDPLPDNDKNGSGAAQGSGQSDSPWRQG